MNRWYAKNIGDGMTAWEPLETIKQRFNAAYLEAGRPMDMAVFYRHASEGRLHCEVMVYFSPAAMDLALDLGADSCPAPAPESVSLLAGSDDAWSVLFPGT